MTLVNRPPATLAVGGGGGGSRTDGSYAGSSILLAASCWPCHGRFVRCGDTSTQEPLSALKRRWEMSSRMASGMLLL